MLNWKMKYDPQLGCNRVVMQYVVPIKPGDYFRVALTNGSIYRPFAQDTLEALCESGDVASIKRIRVTHDQVTCGGRFTND